jgi:hypothetical protein
MEKELENSEKNKMVKQPSGPKSAQPGRAPAPSDRRTPPVSGSSPSRAPSLSRSLPSGADLSTPVFLPLALSLCLAGPDRQSPIRCPAHPFSLCAVGLPCQFCPLRAHRGPACAHSRTSPDFSATTPAHAPSSLLRAPLVPCAHPSPHFAQLHPLSRSARAASRHPCSRPSSSLETAPSLPELRPEVRHPFPCPISPIAPCARPILPSPVLGHGGSPCSRGGRSI